MKRGTKMLRGNCAFVTFLSNNEVVVQFVKLGIRGGATSLRPPGMAIPRRASGSTAEMVRQGETVHSNVAVEVCSASAFMRQDAKHSRRRHCRARR